MAEKLGASERKKVVLDFVSMMTDGATPADIAREFNLSNFYSAVLLSRYKRQGIILKRKCADGKCRYLLTPKGERKLAFIESLR